jgi:hypothetical protein
LLLVPLNLQFLAYSAVVDTTGEHREAPDYADDGRDESDLEARADGDLGRLNGWIRESRCRTRPLRAASGDPPCHGGSFPALQSPRVHCRVPPTGLSAIPPRTIQLSTFSGSVQPLRQEQLGSRSIGRSADPSPTRLGANSTSSGSCPSSSSG